MHTDGSGNPRSYIHYLAGRFPNRIGILIIPRETHGPKTAPPPFWLPYAIDNGAYTNWNPERFEMMLLRSRTWKLPLWVVVPDVVADHKATLARWHEWKDRVASFGYPLAFACQDGCQPEDVPREAFCCFIGGSTEWKLVNAAKFKGVRPWLHVGRVSTGSRLRWAESIGADSCDGTGWFREGIDGDRCQELIEYFEGSPQLGLFQVGRAK